MYLCILISWHLCISVSSLSWVAGTEFVLSGKVDLSRCVVSGKRQVVAPD